MFFQRKKNTLRKRLWHSRVTPTNSPRQQHRQEPCSQSYYQLNETSADYYPPSPEKVNYHRNCGLAREQGGSLLSTTTAVLTNCCSNSNSSSSSDSLEPTARQLFLAFVDQLKKDTQLEMLCQAVDSLVADASGKAHPRQYDPKACVLVQRQTIQGEEPQVIACRLWRWNDLFDPNEIKPIPTCQSIKDPVYVCCNPAHWSRLCLPETPPPPYQYAVAIDENTMDQDEYGGYSKQQIGSLTTDGEDPRSGWCQLAYWEMGERVGSFVPVETCAIDVFSEQPRGDGLCIPVLAKQRQTRTPDAVLKTREKIGLGVTLSRELDGVWLYNRSSSPVFVHSPTLCDINSRTTNVHKVLPGHCLRAFDPLKVNESIKWPSHIRGFQLGPVDPHSLKISFVKGWGLNYSRQDVNSCPCWMEVLLNRDGLHCPCR